MAKPAQDSRVPGEVSARPGSVASYQQFTAEDALYRPYELPGQFLQGIRPEVNALPDCPLIVFINARSGGNQGPDLARALSRALGRAQVFDLSVHKPEPVLAHLWENFKASIIAGVPNAAWYQNNLRILVAGGDGTITWVLAVIKKLKLTPVPPVAVLPLGTGNDLARSLGWGPAFEEGWINGYMGLYNTLVRMANAKVEDLDCWGVRITFPRQELVGKLPHCLNKTQSDAPPPPSEGDQTAHSSPRKDIKTRVGGFFWNYVSVGLDARAAYYFHDLRERRPELASSRMINQFWYSFFSCTSGWFCCTKPVTAKARLLVFKPELDEWVEVELPNSVRALVILNLQSYAGGRNLWGPHHAGDTSSIAKKTGQDTLQEPSYNDGKVEVVGLLDGYHTGAVMASKGNAVHALRICQAVGVRVELKAQYVRPDGTPSHAYLQVDGEPWIQDVPSSRDSEPITVEIVHQGVSKVLHSQDDDTGVGCLGIAPSNQPAIARKSKGIALQRQDTASLRPHAAGPVASALASMAGTVGAESDMVNVGSERASSMHSGNSWMNQSAGGFRTSAAS